MKSQVVFLVTVAIIFISPNASLDKQQESQDVGGGEELQMMEEDEELSKAVLQETLERKKQENGKVEAEIPGEEPSDGKMKKTSTRSIKKTRARRKKKRRPYEARVFALLLAEEELPYSFDIYYWSLKIAEERVNELYGDFLDIKVKIKRSPIRCDSSAAPVYAAEEYYTKGLSALLGPSCTRGLEPVARMAAYWKVPLCSPGGIDVKFEDKKVFSTLTRITFSLDQIGNVVGALLKKFQWRHVALLVDEAETLYESLKDHLGNYLQENAEQEYTFSVFAFNRNSRKKAQISKILRRGSRVARIMILIAGGESVRNILLEAEKLGMGSGEFAFIAIDFMPSKEIYSHFSWFRPGDANNQVRHGVPL